MEVDLADPSNIAPQACVACRKQKRKCSKELPSCSLCTRMSRPCDYSDNIPNPTAEDFAMMRQKITDLEARLEGRRSDLGWHEPLRTLSKSPGSGGSPLPLGGHGTTYFPAVFFLDAEVFIDNQMAIPRPSIPVPQEILATLGTSILDIQDIVDRYFANIHTWLPFVSKKRLELTLLNPAFEMTLDLALLLLAMKLILQVPAADMQSIRSPLYSLTKRYFALVESSGLMSLQILQANVLIAAYELGHAIYPAAYLTSGNCARWGHTLGLNDRRHAPQILKRRPGAWAELEEQKRAWWATMLLDRYVRVSQVKKVRDSSMVTDMSTSARMATLLRPMILHGTMFFQPTTRCGMKERSRQVSRFMSLLRPMSKPGRSPELVKRHIWSGGLFAS